MYVRTQRPPCDCCSAVQALSDKVNDIPLIALVPKGSHRVRGAQKKSGILVLNMLKCRTFETHVPLVLPPVLTPGAQTFMAWERIRPAYGVPRHRVAREEVVQLLWCNAIGVSSSSWSSIERKYQRRFELGPRLPMRDIWYVIYN